MICFFLYHSAWHVVGIQEVDFCSLAGGKACVLWYLRVGEISAWDLHLADPFSACSVIKFITQTLN